MEIPQATLDLLRKFELTKEKKFHNFQIVGKVISDWCGTPAYYLFSIYDHAKIKEAFFIIEKKGIHSLPYMIGVIKKLK